MNAFELAKAVERFLAEHRRPICVYVGPDGAIGYSEPTVARDLMPMKLAGVFDENVSAERIREDLIAAGLQR